MSVAPYKLFDYFVEDDRSRFYGRERDIEELVARVVSGRTLVLYGRSGIGKTSLVRAGVIPALAERRFQAVYVRLLREPLADLRAQVAASLGVAPGPLPEMVAASPRPAVILLDQFEEIFIRFPDPEDRRAVAEELTALLTATDAGGRLLDVRVVVSLRQDWVAELDELGRAWSDLLDRRFRLRGLSAFGARRAIAQPLTENRIAFAPALVNKLVDDLSLKSFEPLLLQILCSEVLRAAEQRSPGAVRMEVGDYDAVGGTEGIFLRYLDGVDAAVPKERRLLLRLVLDALITDERTKRATTLEKLADGKFRARRPAVQAILDRLVEGRLLRAQPSGGEIWYELVHDQLVEVVIGWLERDRDFLQFRFARALVEQLAKNPLWREDARGLLVRAHLEGVVRPFRSRLLLQPAQVELVFWSAVAAQSKELRFWVVAHGTQRSVEQVLALLQHPDATLRAGAAWAVGLLRRRDDEAVGRCLGLALRDPSEIVRRAAAQSVASIASLGQLADLHAALRGREPELRLAAHAVLGEVMRAGRHGQGFSFLERRRARRVAERRFREEHATELDAREQAATITGLVAGLVWWVVVGVPLVCAGAWLHEPSDWISSVSIATLLGGLLSLAVVCPWLGRYVVRTAAYDAHMGRPVRWWRAVLSGRVTLWSLLGFTLAEFIPVYSWVEHMRMGKVLTAGLSIAISFTAYAVVAVPLVVVVGLAHRAMRGTPGRREITAVALASAIGLPLIALVVLLRVLLRDVHPSAEAILASWVACGATSLVVSTSITTLGVDARRASLRRQTPSPEPSAPWRARVGVLAAALAVIGGLARGVVRHRDVIPFAAPIIPVSAAEKDLDVEITPGFPLPHWIRLENTGEEPWVVEIRDHSSLEVARPRISSIPPVRLVVPPGRHPLLVSSSSEQSLPALRLGGAAVVHALGGRSLELEDAPAYLRLPLVRTIGSRYTCDIAGVVHAPHGASVSVQPLAVMVGGRRPPLMLAVDQSGNPSGVDWTASVPSDEILAPSSAMVVLVDDGGLFARRFTVSIFFSGDFNTVTSAELLVALVADPPPKLPD